MESPELIRYCVLQTKVIAELLAQLGVLRTDPEVAETLQELDALTMVLAHRGRSAIRYHQTARGKDALANAQALAELGNPDDRVELLRYRFSQEQASSGFRMGRGPEEEVRIMFDARDVELLSDEFQGPPPVIEPVPAPTPTPI